MVTPAGMVTEPCEVTFEALYPVVQLLPGEDYARLDPESPGRRWRVETLRQPGDPALRIHWDDCWVAMHNPRWNQITERLVADDRAIELLADPDEATACDVCDPLTVLRHLR